MDTKPKTTIMGTPKVTIISNRSKNLRSKAQTANPVTNQGAKVESAPTPAPTPKTSPIVKSRKRTSLDEFAHRVHLRPEIRAGFRAWLNGRYFAFDNEWEQLYTDYTNRKI